MLQFMVEGWFGGLFKAETGFLYNFAGTAFAVRLRTWERARGHIRRSVVHSSWIPEFFLFFNFEKS